MFIVSAVLLGGLAATALAGNAVVDPRAGEPEGERIELWPEMV